MGDKRGLLLLLLTALYLEKTLGKIELKPSPGWVRSSKAEDIEEWGRKLEEEENECLNNQKFYPIHWGDSTEEKTTCLQVVQSNQDSNSDSDDKEDWILTGGSSGTTDIVGSTSKTAYMQLFHYLGGLRWSFYLSGSGTNPDEIADCGFGNYGLQSIFLTVQPMHLFIFETLTGNLLYQWKEPTGNAIVYRGLETRL